MQKESMHFLYNSKDIAKLAEWCAKYPDSAQKAIDWDIKVGGRGNTDYVIEKIKEYESEKEAPLGELKHFKLW